MKNLADVFEKLSSILHPYREKLDCTVDSAEHLNLNTRFIQKNNKPLFFGAVKINKNYVSYHLMPVYVNPQLLGSISAELKKRMQGKSCFNFTSIEPAILQELTELTGAGYQDYQRQGFV